MLTAHVQTADAVADVLRAQHGSRAALQLPGRYQLYIVSPHPFPVKAR